MDKEMRSGDLVRVTAGKYSGEVGKLSGAASKAGNLPVLIAGRVAWVSPDSLERYPARKGADHG